MTDRYGNVRVTKIKAALDAHRAAVYSGDPEAILETWRTFEQWADIVFRKPTKEEAARVLREFWREERIGCAKAALRAIAGDAP